MEHAISRIEVVRAGVRAPWSTTVITPNTTVRETSETKGQKRSSSMPSRSGR